MSIIRACLVVMALLAPAVVSTTWVDGEMGYRITVAPPDSPAARHGLTLGDILAEPRPLPQRLADAGPAGVEIPLYRLDTTGAYRPTTLRIVFREGEEHRLGTTGDLGFLITNVKPGSLAARAELKAGDFIPKINDRFVHDVADLKLVDEADEKDETVLVHFIRWLPNTSTFETAISRRRFAK